MIQQILFLFFLGIVAAIVSYLTRRKRVLSVILATVAGLLLAIPFLLVLYFIYLIVTAY